MPIILLTENVPFFFRSPIFDECFGKYSSKRALLPWYRSLSLNYRIYPDIIRKPIRAYSRPKLWVIFTPFSLKNFWKPPFLCLFGHILHPCPPRLDHALAVCLIPSFSQNFNRKSNSFTRSPLYLYFTSDVGDTVVNNLGDNWS